MGRDYSEGKSFSPMVLPKRPCLDSSRPMDVAASGGANDASGGGRRTDDDVLFYVGKRRQTFNVSAESLTRGSAYFRNLLQGGGAADHVLSQLRPIVVDCEESVFESLLLLMRYGTWEALPHNMSEAEIFKLKREAQIYGVQYLEAPPKTPTTAAALVRASSTDQSIISSLSPASSPGGSPKSDTDMSLRHPASRRLSAGRFHEGTVSRRHLAELPDFPLDLLDPAKLLLVTCMDEEKAHIYICSYCSGGGTKSAVPTQWALSFHHRHAFCTSCGRTPAYLPPKHFAEMFTAAATHYHSAPLEQVPTKQQGANWWVGCDSTCLLRFVSSDGSGPDACRSAACASSCEADTVWAVTFLYSHAFCTRCGQAAHSPALVSLLLAIRYGGISNKKCARRQLS